MALCASATACGRDENKIRRVQKLEARNGRISSVTFRNSVSYHYVVSTNFVVLFLLRHFRDISRPGVSQTEVTPILSSTAFKAISTQFSSATIIFLHLSTIDFRKTSTVYYHFLFLSLNELAHLYTQIFIVSCICTRLHNYLLLPSWY